MTNLEIAIKAYAEIVKAIMDLEESHQMYCGLPEFIEVNGERFHKSEVHELPLYRKKGKI
jgi:hypothetical protein